jgi:hypothetical protein
MLSSFRFSVPADARYRVLAPEVAGKYAELAGCPEAEATAVLTEVDRAAASVARVGENISLVFNADGQELLVTLSCGMQSATVRRALAPEK